MLSLREFFCAHKKLTKGNELGVLIRIVPWVHTPVYYVSPRWGSNFRLGIVTVAETQTHRVSPNGATHYSRGCEPTVK